MMKYIFENIIFFYDQPSFLFVFSLASINFSRVLSGNSHLPESLDIFDILPIRLFLFYGEKKSLSRYFHTECNVQF